MEINELKRIVRQVINESSLSRTHQHMIAHNCAIITAFRYDPTDDSSCAESASSEYQSGVSLKIGRGKERKLPTLINKMNNRDLKAHLLKRGYGVTSVDGAFVENFGEVAAKEVKEDSLFVVDLSDDPTFFDNIRKYGRMFCQDSVLIVPKGGKGTYLYGTNNSSFPGLDQMFETGDVKMGVEGMAMTKVRNRPFTTKLDEKLETYKSLSNNAKLVVELIVNKYNKMEK